MEELPCVMGTLVMPIQPPELSGSPSIVKLTQNALPPLLQHTPTTPYQLCREPTHPSKTSSSFSPRPSANYAVPTSPSPDTSSVSIFCSKPRLSSHSSAELFSTSSSSFTPSSRLQPSPNVNSSSISSPSWAAWGHSARAAAQSTGRVQFVHEGSQGLRA